MDRVLVHLSVLRLVEIWRSKRRDCGGLSAQLHRALGASSGGHTARA